MGFGGVKQSGTGWREAGRRGARRLLRLEVRQPDRRPGEDVTSAGGPRPRARRVASASRGRTSGRWPGTRCSRMRSRPRGSRAWPTGGLLHRLGGDRGDRPLVRRRGRPPPAELATSTSPDVEWLRHALGRSRSAASCSRSCGRRARSAAPRPCAARWTQLLATGGRLDPRRRAGQAAPREDVGRRGRDDASAARPVAPRGAVARQPVPGAARGVRAEQRARDRVDARVAEEGTLGGRTSDAVLHGGRGGIQHRPRGRLGAGRGARRVAARRRCRPWTWSRARS